MTRLLTTCPALCDTGKVSNWILNIVELLAVSRYFPEELVENKTWPHRSENVSATKSHVTLQSVWDWDTPVSSVSCDPSLAHVIMIPSFEFTLSQFLLNPGQQQPDISENTWRSSPGRVAPAVVSPAPTTSLPPGRHAQRYPVTGPWTCWTYQRAPRVPLEEDEGRNECESENAAELNGEQKNR